MKKEKSQLTKAYGWLEKRTRNRLLILIFTILCLVVYGNGMTVYRLQSDLRDNEIPQIGEYILDIDFGMPLQRVPSFLDTDLFMTWIIDPKCNNCHGEENRYNWQNSKTCINTNRSFSITYHSGNRTTELEGSIYKEEYDVTPSLRGHDLYVGISTNEKGSVFEYHKKSTGALGLGFSSFHQYGGYINDLYNKGKIYVKKVGFYLREYKDSEITFGGEDTGKIAKRYPFNVYGLGDHWDLSGLIGIKIGGAYLNNKKIARFSTASPYIQMDMPTVLDLIKYLKRRNLDCQIDPESSIILCKKIEIKSSDFPDLMITINSKDFVVPAAKLVDLLSMDQAVYKIQSISNNSLVVLGTPFFRNYYTVLEYTDGNNGIITIATLPEKKEEEKDPWWFTYIVVPLIILLVLLVIGGIMLLQLLYPSKNQDSSYRSTSSDENKGFTFNWNSNNEERSGGGEAKREGGIKVGVRR